jgi:hypothetical protein
MLQGARVWLFIASRLLRELEIAPDASDADNLAVLLADRGVGRDGDDELDGLVHVG